LIIRKYNTFIASYSQDRASCS